MGLRQRGSVIGNYVTASNTSASGMWTGKEAYTLQKKGTWQLSPTFSIAAGAANVNEGASINFTMTTTGIANGTVIPYTASGANITILDSANSSLSGNFVIQNGSNTISFSANLDLTTEGNEVLQITAAGATANVTINDTSTTPVTTDAQFPYTTLLLNGQGTNNSQNNTFLDSSTNTYTLTRNGNSTQGTFSPYGGNWSTSFSDSAGDYLEISSSTAFALGTGDFTIEAWIYPFSYGGSVAGTAIFGTTAGSGTGYSLNLGESQDRMRILSNASGTWADNLVVSAGGGAPLHTWSHIAWVRSGNSMTIYKNGVSVATMSGVSGYNFTSPGNKGFIGFWWDGGTTRYFNGYISNLRVVKGTALYTTTFTPSTTPLTAVANTSLLTCQDNRFIDDSPNNFTITRYIAPKIQKFNPFSPVITTPTTYSGYFDGTGDYLTVPASNNWVFTGDHTIEAWIYIVSLSSNGTIFGTGGSGAADQFTYESTGTLYWGNQGTGAGVITTNTWIHVAAARSGNTLKIFVNGTSQATATVSGTIGQNLTAVIGMRSDGFNAINGYISNLRIVNGTAVYTSNFTPPTTPLTAIANTSLLTCQSPTFIDNSTNAFPITVVGGAIPTTVNPFGFTNTSSEYSTTTFGGSAYFDGSGDYLGLSSAASPAGLEDFTIEFWYYPLSAPSFYPTIWSNGGGYNATTYLSIIDRHNSSPTVFRVEGASTTVVGTTVVKNNTWYHIAVTRQNVSGTYTMRLFVNGVLDGSSASASGSLSPVVTYFSRGDDASHNAGYTHINSYVSNARIVRGTAVYTSNFAPPVAPVTAVANTSMLLNFTNAGVIDNAMMTTLETVGDAKISSTQSKFGGTSMSFDGTGDYLSIPNNPSLNLSSGDWTIEAWVYQLVNTAGATIVEKDGVSGSSYVQYSLGCDGGGKFTIDVGSGNGTSYIQSINASGFSNQINTWYHLAAVKSGTTITLYIDGINRASATQTGTMVDGGKVAMVGYQTGQGSGSYWNGYIDDLRITKGYARYTSNFTPPENQLAGK